MCPITERLTLRFRAAAERELFAFAEVKFIALGVDHFCWPGNKEGAVLIASYARFRHPLRSHLELFGSAPSSLAAGPMASVGRVTARQFEADSYLAD